MVFHPFCQVGYQEKSIPQKCEYYHTKKREMFGKKKKGTAINPQRGISFFRICRFRRDGICEKNFAFFPVCDTMNINQ